MDTKVEQERIAAWVLMCFGNPAMSIHERGMRFLEEAIELAQAVGITRLETQRMAEVVYDRPPGEPAQECGGTMLGIMGLAEAVGLNAGHEAVREIERVYSKSPDHFRKRQAEKHALGVSMAPEPSP